MKRCPVCRAPLITVAHRQGVLDRGLLTWLRIFPYRCARCQTRFYRLAWRDPRTHGMLAPPPPDHRPRGPRWPMRIPVVVELFRADPPVAPLRGETVNLSLEGVEIRLPVRLPVESRVHVTREGAAMRSGSVRWTKPAEVSGVLHGVELHAPIEHRAPHARPLRRLRRRQFLRRLGFALVGLVLIAITTAGLVWLMEAFRNYNPKYYEPKDFERERYEIQRRSGGSP